MGCKLWTGAKLNSGYGAINRQGRVWGIHRWTWFSEYGPIPKGLDVCHTCDNRLCYNLDHLFLGTRQENMRDCYRKNRARHIQHYRGQAHTKSKLSDQEVLDIRQLRAFGYSGAWLSNHYGVTQTLISSICLNKVWRHLL